jgi:hypothetical protein
LGMLVLESEGVKTMGQLYKIEFKNGKSYVGISSISAEHRFKLHSTQPRYLIGNAFKKYGANDTQLTVLAEHDDWDTLCQMEASAIIEHNTKAPNGYNITSGGEGVLGFKPTEEQNKARSEARKDFVLNNPEKWIDIKAKSKEKLSTPEVRQKMSEIKKAFIVNNPEKWVKQRAKTTATQQTPEVRKKFSENKKAYILNNPEEWEKQMDKANKAHQTPEFRKSKSEWKKIYNATHPEEVAKRIAKAKETMTTPEARRAASERAKLQFSTPEAKIRQRCSIAVGHAKKAGRPFSYLPDARKEQGEAA